MAMADSHCKGCPGISGISTDFLWLIKILHSEFEAGHVYGETNNYT
jgi:hypothetical protein